MVVTEDRTATRQALIDWRGNRYSVSPELAGAKVFIHQRLGASTIDISTVSGVVLARRHLTEAGLGATIRDGGHVATLGSIAMAARNPVQNFDQSMSANARATSASSVSSSTPAGSPGCKNSPGLLPVRNSPTGY